MATAAPLNAAKRKAAAEAAQRIATITVKGAEYKLALNNIPLREKIAVRKACGGMPFETFWSDDDRIGSDSLMVLVWLARRASGEPDLPLQTVEDEWPVTLEDGDIEMTVDEPDPEDDHPET